MSHTSAQLLDAFLSTTDDKIIPLTAEGVAAGCKVFGAAILRKSDLSVIVVATNNEISSPLLHGEINCIQHFYALPSGQRPLPSECLFFATHEPCSLCLSGITWSGFDNHYFLFTYEDTRDAFNIPHDIRILEQVFKVPASSESPTEFANRPLYNKSNEFWTARSVAELIEDLEGDVKEAMKTRAQEIKVKYNGLSKAYQDGKGNADIPLA
ncbi:CMP/dCMP deaminase zinc-binding protein [Cryptococcus gattii NT-10]|nr:CMP/dCMP deaminase zinc-binding protein [Cryptococcus gattii NT-10]